MAVGGAPPEYPKGFVKERQIGGMTHQQGPGRQPEIVAAAANGNELRRPRQVQDVGGADIQPQPAQNGAEQQQVGENGALAGIRGGGVEIYGGGRHRMRHTPTRLSVAPAIRSSGGQRYRARVKALVRAAIASSGVHCCCSCQVAR